ncbi:MAG: flavodoxin family protein [Actinobacteria bacterium]|nr:flavodoxin family protein [Actinomycetota bacterium]MCB9412688.1 flavodoxin family protein [Actinomycetota bacterium]
MRALVIFESMFGGTQTVAQAIASGVSAAVGESAEVEVLEVSSAPTQVPADVDLLIVGAPTHAFGLSRPNTRDEAAKKTDEPLVSTGDGIREWLAATSLPAGQRATAFDTRMAHPKAIVKFDHANHSIEKALRKLGAEIVCAPEKFTVVDVTGPLAEGEQARAEAWGSTIATSWQG